MSVSSSANVADLGEAIVEVVNECIADYDFTSIVEDIVNDHDFEDAISDAVKNELSNLDDMVNDAVDNREIEIDTVKGLEREIENQVESQLVDIKNELEGKIDGLEEELKEELSGVGQSLEDLTNIVEQCEKRLNDIEPNVMSETYINDTIATHFEDFQGKLDAIVKTNLERMFGQLIKNILNSEETVKYQG